MHVTIFVVFMGKKSDNLHTKGDNLTFFFQWNLLMLHVEDDDDIMCNKYNCEDIIKSTMVSL